MKSLIGRSRKWMVFFIDVNYDRAGRCLALIRVATDKYVTSLILFQTRNSSSRVFFFFLFLLLFSFIAFLADVN